ncbi:phosphoribosyltransferase [Pulveribacter suum]|uniref:Phosphoribosyl transferase n=1 Tax=Pulveribacter suum TaxID=2116657 RepID=A0A2P1NKP2_9BURK|nr:phosphoribosyltransferase family protein [Pulveribacter suum]AVP57590.1 phosphoribosyl transferase [Pulveribacter suum]
MDALTYRDRSEAGQVLARALEHYRGAPNALVLALPRGGVPVAYEVTHTLGLPLDVFLVRKIGHPERREFAVGALASGGALVLEPHAGQVQRPALDDVLQQETLELERRERLYRRERPLPPLAGRTVIVVDDGVATGASMRAAAQAIRAQGPARLVLAVPVGEPEVCQALRTQADEVICPRQPQPLGAVGRWYQDFAQLDDEQVLAYLQRAQQQTAGAQP